MLWKRIEDIKNAPNDTVPVLAEDHIKLTEQAVLRLGQASNSVLNIKNLTNPVVLTFRLSGKQNQNEAGIIDCQFWNPNLGE